MWSRLGKEFIPEVVSHLLFDTGNIITDGELMLPHLQHSFQDTMKAVKKSRPETDGLLEYHIYDCYLPDEPNADLIRRREVVLDIFAHTPHRVIPVVTELVHDDAEIADWHRFFTSPEQGFEGTIIRTPGGVYTPGHRSVNLLKHKDFVDEEFIIVDTMDGKGKFEGAIMFKCVTADGREFDCGLRGSIDDRKVMFANREQYLGKLLTVKFQEKTEDGIPRFPVGISIRDSDLQG